jgi:hypothetical protein
MSLDEDIQSIVAVRERLPDVPVCLARLVDAILPYRDSVVLLAANIEGKRELAQRLLEVLRTGLTGLEAGLQGCASAVTRATAFLVTELDGLRTTLERAEEAVRAQTETTAQEMGALRTALQALGQDVIQRRDQARTELVNKHLALLQTNRLTEEAISTASAAATAMVDEFEATTASASAATEEFLKRIDLVDAASERHLVDVGRGRLEKLFLAHRTAVENALDVFDAGSAAAASRLPPVVQRAQAAIEQAAKDFALHTSNAEKVLHESVGSLENLRPPLSEALLAVVEAQAAFPPIIDAAREGARQVNEPW